MKYRNGLLLLACLATSPLYAKTVDPFDEIGSGAFRHGEGGSTEEHGKADKDASRKKTDGDHKGRDKHRKTHFTSLVDIERAGIYQVYIDDRHASEDESQPVKFRIGITAKEDGHSSIVGKNHDFLFEATPGEYEIDVWTKPHRERHPGDFNVRVTALNNSPVPLPAAIWLFGSGLIGLIGAARRKAG